MQIIEKLASAIAVTPTCPHCKQVIASEDVNVANDIAFCRNCNLSCSLSGMTLGTPINENVDFNSPPAGCWFRQEPDATIIGSTHRSLGQALPLLFFCLFWNGIVSVFVGFAAASTLHHLGLALPKSFPLFKGDSIPLPMTIFLWLFLTPFIAIGLLLLGTFLSSLGGQTELRIASGDAVLFSGIGPLGFRKRFLASDVRDVRIEDKRWRDSDGNSRRNTQIIIETGAKPIKFGSLLTPERRQFVAAAAKKELLRH